MTLLLLAGMGSLLAQAPSARLHGQVTDPSGAVIPGAAIILKNSSGLTIPAKSDGAGAYDVKGLAPGTYTVTVTSKGFVTMSLPAEITAGQDKKMDFSLEILTKEVEVVVESESAKVSTNPDNNASVLVISGKDLDALSDDPDELQSELQALAGPSAGPNGGQIYIDGFTGGQLPPKSSIREIRINQNPFSAQYDRMGFGRIEILTKPGTDKPHGQFFYNDNHSIFDGLNPFGAAEPDFSSEILNGNVGGPLSKKASYFFNIERRNIHDAAVILGSAFVADNNQTPVPILNPRIRTNLSGRLDYQLATNNTFMVRYQFTHNNEQNDGIAQFTLPSQAYNLTSTEHTVQISDTQVLSPKAINETRFEWQRETTNQNALSVGPLRSTPSFVDGGNPIGVGEINVNHFELQNYTSINFGTHFVRLGGRLRSSAETSSSTQNFNGSFVFDTASALSSHTPNQLTIVTGIPHVSNTFVDVGLYAEDDWKLRPNMTLSYGLRYETQNGINDRRDWAPRLGFAWGLGAKKNTQPKTILRTGFGMFYDRFTQGLLLQAKQFSPNGAIQQRFVVSDPACLAQAYALYPAVPTLSTVPCLSQGGTSGYTIDPGVRAPYTIQAVASVERQVNKYSTLIFNFIHSHGVHQLFSINSAVESEIQTGTFNPLNPPTPVYDYLSEGVFTQNQLLTQFNVRAGTRLTLFSFYAFGHANGDTSGAGSFPSDPVHGLGVDYGRTAYDVHHRLFVGGTYSLPHAFRISPFLVANSGAPYNVTIGRDLNGDAQFNDRPALATAATKPGNIVTVPGFPAFDIAPALGTPTIPVNFGNGPAQFTLNLRLSKTFGIGPKLEATANNQQQGGQRGGEGGRQGGGAGGPRGGPGGPGGPRGGPGGPMGGVFGGGERSNQRYSLTFSANARNVFNKVNPGQPVGNLSSPLFGQSTSLAGGIFNTQSANRRVDFQVMFAF
jgi:hypothetical protein